jgi:hypothetical protein
MNWDAIGAIAETLGALASLGKTDLVRLLYTTETQHPD